MAFIITSLAFMSLGLGPLDRTRILTVKSVEEAQAIIDAASDGTAVASDLTRKLRFGAGPFNPIDLGTIEGPGILRVSNRQGLWFRSAFGSDVSWEIENSEAIILTNPRALFITVDGGSSRIETYKQVNGRLSVSNATVYAGKIIGPDVSIHASSGFLRGSEIGHLELSGEMSGFDVIGVTWDSIDNTATGLFTVH